MIICGLSGNVYGILIPRPLDAFFICYPMMLHGYYLCSILISKCRNEKHFVNGVCDAFFINCFRAHYNVVMKAIDVGGNVLQLPTDEFDTQDQKGTIIDSGTTLAYLPEEIYEPLVNKVSHGYVA